MPIRNLLFGNAEQVKFVQQELVVTGSLWFPFPAAFIKGLLLSGSGPAWLSAAKSTIPSAVALQYQPWATRAEIPSCLCPAALHSGTGLEWLSHSCAGVPWLGQAAVMNFFSEWGWYEWSHRVLIYSLSCRLITHAHTHKKGWLLCCCLILNKTTENFIRCA